MTHSTQSKSVFMDMKISVGGYKKPTKHPLVFRDIVCADESDAETPVFDMFVSMVEYDAKNDTHRVRCSTTLGIGSLTMLLHCPSYGDIDVLDMKGDVLEQNISILTDVLLAHKQQLIHWLQS